MIDYLQSVLALTLSILIHTGIAYFGDSQMGQSGAGESGPLWVTVASLSQPAAATSGEDSSLAGVKAVESILYTEAQPPIENSEPPEPTEAESSKVDHLQVEQTATDKATEELDTQIKKVEKPIEPEPTLEEPKPQAPIETKTPPVNENNKEVMRLLTGTQFKEKPETSTMYIDNTKLSGSKSSVSKTEPTQASDAESTPREYRLHLRKPDNPIHQIDDLTTAMNTPNAEESSNSETTDTTDISKSTNQSGEKDSGVDTGSNPFFSDLRTFDLAKKKKITVPVKTETIAIPLYHLIPKPPYPSRSRDLGEEGTVIIVILVGTDGKVKEAELSQSSGYSLLDGSALATIKEKWQFKPGTRNGKPIESRVQVPIKFSISDL